MIWKVVPLTPVNFAHIGMGNLVQANRVLAVTNCRTITAKRYLSLAKKTGKYMDATLGRPMKSLLIMDEGTVIISCLTYRTILKRLNNEQKSAPDPDEENDIPDEDSVEEFYAETVFEDELLDKYGEDTND